MEEIKLNILLKISIVLVAGIIGGKLAKLLKLPNVSGYLVVGLFLGPSFFGDGFITKADAEQLTIISEIALAVIAFSIGSEFIIKDILKMGRAIFIITLAEVIGAVVLVFLVMFFGFGQPFAFSIVIAAMSAATAPAATLLVMRQYRAHGPVTKTLLPVVALDDVFGIIIFGIAMSLARVSLSTEQLSVFKMISAPLIEIFGSLLLGLVIGIILSFVTKKAQNRDDLQVVSLAAIGLAVGLSKWLGLSPLLTNIMVGTVLVNLVNNPNRVFGSVNDFISPFYVLFFTIAGASLDLNILFAVGAIGIAYVFARAAGKMFGAWVGAKAVKADKNVVKYLGLGLLPQGGISIGLSVLVKLYFDINDYTKDLAVKIVTIIMFSVLIYETMGPIFAKIAISKAGEVNGIDRLNEPVINQNEPSLAHVSE